jgi:UDP-N-acetylglucosamine--N-acetylmuramyl-(pentapeptide) pyrophosphoryl-undecaprenol N-acetylglucosamine transferase
MSSGCIILSAGGTGGHVMPAQALAHDLIARGYRVEVITDTRGLKYKPHFEGIPMHEIRAGALGRGLKGKLLGLCNIGLGVVQAFKILRAAKPLAVIGFGGYPSFPAMYAAQKLKIPTIVHEQNAIIGKANLMLVAKAVKIAISMPTIKGLDEQECTKAVYTGNPVRAEIAALYNKPFPALSESGKLRILVMGGSLGASVFSHIIPEAFSRLSSDHRARLDIVQQCRSEDLESTAALYKKYAIQAQLSVFIDDVAGALEACHLVIARSGASTVAEVSTAGRPAIFVPYPHHKDQQQKINADTLADAGGAWVMTENGFTPEALLARIETFLQNPSVLFKAAENARSLGKPDAARKLGNLVTEVISGWN